MPNQQVNRRVLLHSGSKYDPNAQALFNKINELEPVYGFPDIAKPFFNDFIVACKQSGVWYTDNFWVVTYVPTLNADAVLIEIKSLMIQAVWADTTAMAPPYNIALRVGPTAQGLSCRSTGYINLNFIPSLKMILNNSCAGIMTFSDETGAATYNFGALTSTSSSTAFSKKLNTNAMVADVYGTTVGTGRVSVSSASGSKGWAYVNRTSNLFAEIVENGSTVGSITGSQGTLPSITEYAWTFNNSGTPSTRRLQSEIAMLFKWRGMDSGQKIIMNQALTDFQTNTKLKYGLQTKQIILASNSHGVYWRGATQRVIDYFSFSLGYRVRNVSVSGQQTSALITNFNAWILSLYDGSLSENWVYLDEATNDLWFNGDLAAAKANYVTFVNLCHANNMLVKTSPIMCRKFTGNPGGRTETEFNNDINDFNVWLVGGGSGADVVLDADSNTFEFKGALSDATYNALCAAKYNNSAVYYDASTIGTHLVEYEYFKRGKRFFETN